MPFADPGPASPFQPPTQPPPPGDPNRAAGGLTLGAARGISLAGVAMVALYLCQLAGVTFPLQPLDPRWQLAVGVTLINGSPFPLLALVLVHLAAGIHPSDAPLVARRRRFSERAVAAALGFLLLIPLMSAAALGQNQRFNQERSEQIGRDERKLLELRQALVQARAGATGGQELLTNLVAELDQQVSRQREQAQSLSRWRVLPEVVRNAFACLALAVGFAGLARRRGVPLSLMEELAIRLRPRLRALRLGWPKPSRPGLLQPRSRSRG